ncbi:MAG: CPBP family intramembrane metalloprotease [Actinomycetota bacterium]|nr:CPBP family intramembrane metalloprotease [Actinomycetota bacterium]
MKVSDDVSRSQKQGSLLLAVSFLLLLVRVAVFGRGRLSILLLALVYISLLGLSRPTLRVPDSRALLPAMVGVTTIVAARLFLAPPFPLASTTAGLLLSVLAALAEEAFFRGALFARLEPYGRNIAILVSAVAFALVHVPFYGMAALPVDLGAGLLFSWQRSESGSWPVAAATHALANVLAVVR